MPDPILASLCQTAAGCAKYCDKNFVLLKADPPLPSLHLKKTDRSWSVRAGLSCPALAVEVEDGLLWFWIGKHADHDALPRKRRE